MADLLHPQMSTMRLTPKTTYTLPASGTIQRRESVYITPTTGTQNYTPGQRIIFRFPRRGWLDGQTVKFSFTMNITQSTNSTFAFCNYSISDIIRRIRIIGTSSNEIEDLNQYNELHAFLISYVVPRNYIITSAYTNEGAGRWFNPLVSTMNGTAATWQDFSIYSAVNTTQYLVSFHSGFLGCGIYYPLEYSQDIDLEITLENFPNAITELGSTTNSLGNGTYTLGNPILYYDEVEPVESYKAAIRNQIANGGMQIHYTSFNQNQFLYTGTSATATFADRTRSVKSVIVLPHVAANYGSVLTNYFRCGFQNLADYQFKIGTRFFPVDRVQSYQRAYMELEKAVGMLNAYNKGSVVGNVITPTVSGLFPAGFNQDYYRWGTIYPATYAAAPLQGGNMIFATDLDRESEGGDMDIISGLDTNGPATDILLIINRTSASEGNMNMTMFSYHDRILDLDASGRITVIY